MNNRLNALIESFPNLSSCQDEIRQAFDVLHEVYANGGKLLICGNGGSAADSDHMAGELLKGFTCPRPVDDMWKRKLGTNLSDKLLHQLILEASLKTNFLYTFYHCLD